MKLPDASDRRSNHAAENPDRTSDSVTLADPAATSLDEDSNLGPAVSVESPLLTERHLRSRRRRVGLPIALFVVTCLSCFWAGAFDWQPLFFGRSGIEIRLILLRNWDQGLIYMGCVLAILLTHEMGHFITTLRYRIPASLPFFIPFPITPNGTMGAVIGMEGHRANRKEIFDIGLAGPIAGLIAAIPILWIGIARLDLESRPYGAEMYDCPLLIEWMIAWLRPGYESVSDVRTSQLNPYFMAGWVGLLITGLNMLPVSQLDGGHVIYALFGRRAHWIARGFILLAILFIVMSNAYIWSLMTILVILMGTDHPPTSNDQVSLGPLRNLLGYASLLIPVFCFPPKGLVPVGF